MWTTVSPYVYRATDDVGRELTVTFTFDNATREILDALVRRDAGCLLDRVLTDVMTDGTPTVTTRAFLVDEGYTQIPQSALRSRNIWTVDDLFIRRIIASRG
jgi:hypothetical protein